MLDEITLRELKEKIDREAGSFVVVCANAYTGDVVNAIGPCDQPEQALVEAGLAAAEWRASAGDDVDAASLTFTVVPLWEPIA